MQQEVLMQLHIRHLVAEAVEEEASLAAEAAEAAVEAAAAVKI